MCRSAIAPPPTTQIPMGSGMVHSRTGVCFLKSFGPWTLKARHDRDGGRIRLLATMTPSHRRRKYTPPSPRLEHDSSISYPTLVLEHVSRAGGEGPSGVYP